MGHQAELVHLLRNETRYNYAGVEKNVERSAEFLLQAASKIVPYMPKYHQDLDTRHLLSELNDLAWWYDELAGMERILGIVSDEEARAGADNSEEVIPAYSSGSSMNASSSTSTSTTTRKRPAVDDPLEESRTAKVVRLELVDELETKILPKF